MSKQYTWDEVEKFIRRLGIPWPAMMNRVYLNRYKTKQVHVTKDRTYTEQDIADILGWNELRASEFDYADGHLIDYCWLSSDEGQAGFIPINANLRKLQTKISPTLWDNNDLFRKMTYFAHLENNLKFYHEKYNWDLFPSAFGVLDGVR